MALDDRTLKDIGLERGVIESILLAARDELFGQAGPTLSVPPASTDNEGSFLTLARSSYSAPAEGSVTRLQPFVR
jgi:hypothetical protein